MFKVSTSNRLEILAEALSRDQAEPLRNPFDTEIIVVQSRGMERWLCLQLAQVHGICANFRFPFPNAFIHELFQKFMPDLNESTPFEPGNLTWQLMQKLPDLAAKPGFEALESYLSEESDDLKRLQLAGRIADTFDQYLVFRPEMVLKWEQGTDDQWQAQLWRELVRGRPNMHRAALARLFLQKLAADPAGAADVLPERVTVFGISALPKFYLHLLHAISAYTQVNLYLLNPCREYWGDILSTREIKRKRDRSGQGAAGSAELHFEKGNSLLNSLGLLGRDFFDLLNEFDPVEWSAFAEPEEKNLLGCLQADILNLRERSGSDGKKRLAPEDESIRIHSCHSPMRELEVLRDHLLHFFETLPGLTPRDILVMAPDITEYSPYIQAVFDIPKQDPRRMPFSIADQSLRYESRIIEPFLAILELCRGRFGASEVLDLLEADVVRRRCGLSAADLELIRHWVRETRIRWGMDAQDRAKAGLPAFGENSWQAGLDRLLLGYAMPGRDRLLFNDILPYDRIEGAETEVLGIFSEFMQQLFAQVAALEQPRSPDQWSQTLLDILDIFFSADENQAREMQMVRQALTALGDPARAPDPVFAAPIDLKAVQWHLEQVFNRENFGRGFITGGITFCTMLPMRSIPFRVIALLGLNHDAYPRESKPLSFDLIGRHPRPGDRSRRNDDRYLFLESLLSARDVLYLSYVGRDIRDNTPLPASVLVHELLDYIEGGFEASAETIREQLLAQHRLQPFQAEYFKPAGRLFSYAPENLAIARAAQAGRREAPVFIESGLTEPGSESRIVELENLIQFIRHPARFLLNRRLGLYLDTDSEVFEEEEAFELKGLEQYGLAQDLLSRRLQEGIMPQSPALAKAAGLLPPGVPGDCLYDDLQNNIELFARCIEPFQNGVPLEPLAVDLELCGLRLQGRLSGIYGQGLLRYRYADIKAKDFLRIWIEHLVLNAVATEFCPRESSLFGLEKRNQERVAVGYCFKPVAESASRLVRILEIYGQGLRKPLFFFPQSSFEYAAAVLEKRLDSDEALQKAREKWEGNEFVPGSGERADPYFERCFGDRDPLDRGFQDLAIEIFGPLLEHREKVVL